MTPETERQTFEDMPLVVEGNSKEIRRSGEKECWIRFKPTIYSYTANRAGVVEGSDRLRMRTAEIFAEVLNENGIDHAYKGTTENDLYMVSELIPEPPNIEVIVKRYHVGTPKHRYYDMDGAEVRDSHPTMAGETIEIEDAYPDPIVRFDWRNPLEHPESGERLADEPLPADLADYFIDVEEARQTALQTWEVIHDFLVDQRVMMYDVCFFIDETGQTVFGEISQDCGRFRHFDYGELDKDVWRAGGSSDRVLKKWRKLAEIVENARSED